MVKKRVDIELPKINETKIKTVIKRKLVPKKISIILLIIGILLCITLIVGVSYSIYQVDTKQKESNEIEVGCFTIEFEDSGTDSSTYTDLSITNSYPITTSEALNKTPYKFKITNTCEYIAKTNIAINVLKTSSISAIATNQNKTIGDMLNVAIKEGSNSVSAPVVLSSLNEGTIRSSDNETAVSYIIRTEYLEQNKPKTYSIWMWVPDSINGNEVANEAQGLTLYSRVDVYSVAVEESAIASVPELYQGLIPVEYDNNGNTVVADANDTSWYDYDNHKWANAILGTETARAKSAGEILTEEEILQYYVWIPRYRYQLFNAVAGESADEQMINIEFEDKDTPKSNGTKNGEWLTHPAFTFGDTELDGIWVGKFEPSHSDSQYINSTTANKLGCSNENCTSASGLIIKPNVISMVNNNIANQFYVSRSIENSSIFGLDSSEVDTHMMNNMEWGAVAYLSASKYGLYKDENTCYNSDNNKTVTINGSNVNRCEVWINNVYTGTGCGAGSVYTVAACGGAITGCSAQTGISQGGKSSQTSCRSINNIDYSWNSPTNNGRSSTTGNVYGVYDMAGGTWEYMMANQSSVSNAYTWFPKSSGFSSAPDSKYYDRYLASTYTATETTESQDQARGLLGDVTREIMKTYSNTSGGWNGDYANFVSVTSPWFSRGGRANNGANAGVFTFNRYTGGASTSYSFRVVLSAQ